MAEDEETIEEDNEDEEVRKAGALLTPEGIIMMGAAITLDFIGLVLTILDIVGAGTPEIVNWMSDGAGLFFFGSWLTLRAPFVSDSADVGELRKEAIERRTELTKNLENKRPEIERLRQEAKESIKQAKPAVGRAGRGLRFGIAILGEVIPGIGALPFWTLFVWSELKR